MTDSDRAVVSAMFAFGVQVIGRAGMVTFHAMRGGVTEYNGRQWELNQSVMLIMTGCDPGNLTVRVMAFDREHEPGVDLVADYMAADQLVTLERFRPELELNAHSLELASMSGAARRFVNDLCYAWWRSTG